MKKPDFQHWVKWVLKLGIGVAYISIGQRVYILIGLLYILCTLIEEPVQECTSTGSKEAGLRSWHLPSQLSAGSPLDHIAICSGALLRVELYRSLI